jgi:hypothetical protein
VRIDRPVEMILQERLGECSCNEASIAPSRIVAHSVGGVPAVSRRAGHGSAWQHESLISRTRILQIEEPSTDGDLRPRCDASGIRNSDGANRNNYGFWHQGQDGVGVRGWWRARPRDLPRAGERRRKPDLRRHRTQCRYGNGNCIGGDRRQEYRPRLGPFRSLADRSECLEGCK